jgi:hypothetical protein
VRFSGFWLAAITLISVGDFYGACVIGNRQAIWFTGRFFALATLLVVITL